jgi:hypothetical protein
LWEEVSSLGIIIRTGESGAQLGNNISSRVQALEEKTEGTKHGKTAVLDLLKLLLSIFLRSIVDVEWVPSTGVSKSNISRNAVGALLFDALDTLVFNPGHTSNNLVDGKVGNLLDGLKGVNIREGIGSSEVLVTGEGSEKSRPDETNNGELSDTAVGELGLTKPLKVTHEVTLFVKGVVEGGEGGGGETNGVESNISNKGSIESIGGRSEGECSWRVIELNIKGGGGLALLGRGEGGGGTGKGGDKGELHG